MHVIELYYMVGFTMKLKFMLLKVRPTGVLVGGGRRSGGVGYIFTLLRIMINVSIFMSVYFSCWFCGN